MSWDKFGGSLVKGALSQTPSSASLNKVKRGARMTTREAIFHRETHPDASQLLGTLTLSG